ncbi:lppC lipofamily protein, partial [Escherichia coli 3.4870]
PRLAI